MGEKKVVGRNVVIALGIVITVLLGGLMGAIFNYTSIISIKDSQIQDLISRNNQLQVWLNGNKTLLNQVEAWLQGNTTYYELQIDALNFQIIQLQMWLEENITYYELQIFEKNRTISSLNSQIQMLTGQNSQLQVWLDGNRTLLAQREDQINLLQSQMEDLQGEINSLNSQISTLQT